MAGFAQREQGIIWVIPWFGIGDVVKVVDLKIFCGWASPAFIGVPYQDFLPPVSPSSILQFGSIIGRSDDIEIAFALSSPALNSDFSTGL